MTSPVDTLKALVDAVEAEFCGEATERLEPDDSKVSYPEDRCHITFGHIRRAKAAIAALSGGEAVAWRHRWLYSGSFLVTSISELSPERFIETLVPRPEKLESSEPLYTTPRIPDGCVVVPGHYAQNVLYAAAILEQSSSLIDRREGPVLRKLGALLTAAPGDEGRGDASRP